MHLPEELAEQIQKLTYKTSLSKLSRSSKSLSSQYRARVESRGVEPLDSQDKRLAYLHVRLPATYAAIVRVIQEMVKQVPSLSIQTLGDIGAGPGTGLWAVCSVLPTIQQAHLYERDPHFIELGEQLVTPLASTLKKWICTDVTKEETIQTHDLILASYSLGEIPRVERTLVLKKLWQATSQALVIVEPGTPLGFEGILAMREELIGLGAYLAAPCPHVQKCPMVSPDWCHFSIRVERSSFHRQLKEATLNFEDEKFSYLVAVRKKPTPIQGRIVRHPQKNSGFIKLQVCGESGIVPMTVSRKSKELYRQMRKAEWGDSF